MTKNILILGASGGIGRAIADQIWGQSYINMIGIHGGHDFEVDYNSTKVKKYIEDLSFSFLPSQTVQRFIADVGKIDVLINAVGIANPVSFEYTTPDAYYKLMNISMNNLYFLFQTAFKDMKANNGGKIINISSNTTKYFMGRNGSIPYAMSKAGMDMLVKGMAKLGAPYNILCNSISPGIVDTKFHKNRNLNKRIEQIPLKRAAQPKEIADMVEYLISDKSNFITGQNIRIAGGE